MIICSCNVFSDHDVRTAVTSAKELPRTAGAVYGCLGCSAQCGRCARTIRQIVDEALGACARGCYAGCPHSLEQSDDFALASDMAGLVEEAQGLAGAFAAEANAEPAESCCGDPDNCCSAVRAAA